MENKPLKLFLTNGNDNTSLLDSMGLKEENFIELVPVLESCIDNTLNQDGSLNVGRACKLMSDKFESPQTQVIAYLLLGAFIQATEKENVVKLLKTKTL